jgi:hypothetical protein
MTAAALTAGPRVAAVPRTQERIVTGLFFGSASSGSTTS